MDSTAVGKHPKGSRAVSFAILLFAFAVAFSGWRVWRLTRLRQFAVVKEGVLYRSGQPTEKQLEELVADYGFKTIINLRGVKEIDREVITKKHGLTVVNMPISHCEPLSGQVMSKFLSVVDDPKMQPVLVHCSQGETRTGAIVALYRRQRCGWSREQAIEEMKQHVFNFADKHKPLVESVLADPCPKKTKPMQ